jgi:hypothetical protein
MTLCNSRASFRTAVLCGVVVRLLFLIRIVFVVIKKIGRRIDTKRLEIEICRAPARSSG